jgi:hypothetical protein
MRVTGTEQSFRSEKRDEKGNITQEAEHVWRDPSLYMNQHFLDRCNGLPVVIEHPEGSSLDTEEYRERNIGSLTFPYMKPEVNEVWAIGRIMDAPAAEMMEREQLSTSPAVVWSDPDANQSGTLEDGTRFFIEGKPSLLDHLAVCWQGVWDKGRGPTGISTTRGDSSMPDDVKDKKPTTEDLLMQLLENGKKQDMTIAGLKESLMASTTRLDSIQKRFDEEDEEKRKDAKERLDNFHFSKRKDEESDKEYKDRHDAEEESYKKDMMEEGESEEMAADKAKKRRDNDEEEERKDKRRKDAVKKDGDNDDEKEHSKDVDEDEKEHKKDSRMDADDIKKSFVSRNDFDKVVAELNDLKGQNKTMSDEDLKSVGQWRSRADNIFLALGQDHNTRPHAGESLLLYRRRMASELKGNTKYAKSELSVVAADEHTFGLIEEEIYKEAENFAKSPARLKPGELRMRTFRTDSGHLVNEFDGDPSAWMRTFSPPVKQAVKMFNIGKRQQ